MKLHHVLTSAVLALCCAETVVGGQIKQRRQNTSTPSPASTGNTATSTNGSPSSTASSSPTSAATSSNDQSTNTNSHKTTPTLTTSKTLHTTTSTGHATPTATPAAPPVQLPIQPSITPALGVAGVVLLLTGLVYNIIGIKHKKLLVFLSAAYLASLGVAVLIIYVMDPPVSDAIQGAYTVAAIVTGLIFGAICLIFKEVTEGLGCMLGGFCLAMWLLVVRPGGLIQSSEGRAIMIGVFTAVGWSLSFSQYTRNYGTIVCTAFAGAQITILGIDCFSCAGLKEFWLYIWALNKNEFPLHTTTYPITRGIRVEIACTILLFLFGVMSQMKIWKIVKERREKKEALRLEDESRRDQRDSRVGRRVQSTIGPSLVEWERIYGDKDSAPLRTDSGPGISTDNLKRSTSVTEHETDSVEMADLRRSKNTSTSVTVRAASDDDITPTHTREVRLGAQHSKTDSQSTAGSSTSNGMRTYGAPGPEIVPLPFLPPIQSLWQDEASSVQGSVAPKVPEVKAVHERRGVPLDNLALKRLSEQTPSTLPRIEDDRASSVAATANDGISDFDALSPRRLSGATGGGLSPFDDQFRDKSAAQTPGEEVEEHDEEALVRPPTAQAESHPTEAVRSASRAPSAQDNRPGSALKGNLPDSISKVAMAYRTNEWAKHVADAPQPEASEALEPEEPGVRVAVGRQEEEPRPVDPTALLETGVETEPAFVQTTQRKPSRKSRDSHGLPRRASGATPVYAFQRSGSNSSFRPGTGMSVSHQMRDTRNSSAPLAKQPVFGSPVDEHLGSANPYRNFTTPGSRPITPLVSSTSNLLDERTRILDTKTVTTSFNGLPGVNSFTLSEDQTGSNTPTTESAGVQTPQEENLTLSQRKSLLDQGQLPLTSPPKVKRRESRSRPPNAANQYPVSVLNRMASSSSQNLIYDSHQPKRENSVDKNRQSAMLMQWRQSLQQQQQPDLFGSASPLTEEQTRQIMMNQHQQKSYKDAQRRSRRASRESQIDQAMRSGQLTSAHQNALKKMQAQVNDAAK